MKRLLFLYVALRTVAFAAGPPASDDPFRELNVPGVSSWALGDINGDQIADVVTTPPGRREGEGYAHDVRIRMGGSLERKTFTFRGHSAILRLSIRDLDGDDDRDIVIRGAEPVEVLGVWVNDGSGHFAEGDVARFRGALADQGSSKLYLPEVDDDPHAAIIVPRIDPVALASLIIEPEQVLEAIGSGTDLAPARAHFRDRHCRAPPLNS